MTYLSPICYIAIIISTLTLDSHSFANPPNGLPNISKIKEQLNLNKDKFKDINSKMLMLLQSVKFKKRDLEKGLKGVEIQGISKGSILESIGLKSGDIIVGINEIKFEHTNQSLLLFDALKKAKDFVLQIRRGDQSKEVAIKIK